MFFIFTLTFSSLWISTISEITGRIESCPDPSLSATSLDCDAFSATYPDSPEVCCYVQYYDDTTSTTTQTLEAFANKCVAECNGVQHLSYCGSCCDTSQNIVCADGSCPTQSNNVGATETLGRCQTTDYCESQNQCDDTAPAGSDPCGYRGSDLECVLSESSTTANYRCNECVELQTTVEPHTYSCTDRCTDGSCGEGLYCGYSDTADTFNNFNCKRCILDVDMSTEEPQSTQCSDDHACLNLAEGAGCRSRVFGDATGGNWGSVTEVDGTCEDVDGCIQCVSTEETTAVPDPSAATEEGSDHDARTTEVAGCSDDYACLNKEAGDSCSSRVFGDTTSGNWGTYVDGTCEDEEGCIVCVATEETTPGPDTGTETTQGSAGGSDTETTQDGGSDTITTDASGSEPETTEEDDCDNDRYPYKHRYSNYCDDPSQTGCSLTVSITVDVCNINGWWSSYGLMRLFKSCFRETLDALDDKTVVCDVDNIRLFGRSVTPLNIDDDTALVRGSFRPATPDDCPDLDEYCGEDGTRPQFEVSFQLGLYCGSCDELDTLKEELALLIATGGDDDFESKCEALSTADDAVCGVGLRNVILSDSITATLIDEDGNEYTDILHQSGAKQISFYGVMGVLAVFSFFF